MAVDGDLAVAGLAQGAGVLTRHPDGTLALLGKASVVEDQDGIALGRQLHQALDALAVEVVLVPDHSGEQALEALLRGSGDDGGDGIAVLVGVFGEQPGEVTLQGMPPLRTRKVDVERLKELGQFRQRVRRSLRDTGCRIHTL